MSRFNLTVPMTQKMKTAFCIKFKDIESLPENVYMAWGLDIDGYFIQLWIEEQGDDLYLEEGLLGTNKDRVLDKLEKYGILDFVKNVEPKKFDNLTMNLPL